MKRFMIIAGETSGDLLAAELVTALKSQLAERKIDAEFFGAGGPALKCAGVELDLDLTAHAVVGLVEVIFNYRKWRGIYKRLLRLAIERKPDAVICVDFSGFNRRFARGIREQAAQPNNWNPKIIQYVSPQVWASRPGRAEKMARDFDLLLAIFPFEPAWYTKRVPGFQVEFVGHPLVERHKSFQPATPRPINSPPLIALLPGSRLGELARHLPVMRDAITRLKVALPLRWTMVLPTETLAVTARACFSGVADGTIEVGRLESTLTEADLAIASTGTVTLECAWFGVPAVAIYKTSWGTYQVGKRLIQVRFLAMPNLLADREVLPELIQQEATGARIAQAALGLLRDLERRKSVQLQLRSVVDSLGGPGASQRAAKAIADLISL